MSVKGVNVDPKVLQKVTKAGLYKLNQVDP
jgi:hypothetical protein